MKIMDADCHITPTHYTAEELIRDMDKTGTDRALIWINPHVGQPDELNPYIYESSKRYSDRLMGFGWANPRMGVSAAREQVVRCLEEYGFPGVKLNGAQNDFYIDDPQLSLPVIEEIAKRGKIVAFHTGADAFDKTHPFRVGKLAAMYPEIQFCMVHMGGAAEPNLGDAAIEVAAAHKNIYLVASAIAPKPILKAVKTLSADRVMYGSDSPFGLMRVELAKAKALLEEELSEDELSAFFYGTASRLFDGN